MQWRPSGRPDISYMKHGELKLQTFVIIRTDYLICNCMCEVIRQLQTCNQRNDTENWTEQNVNADVL